MTEHKNIYSALCAAQQEFGQVTKGSTNPAFKSKYADLADVANVVIPTLSRHGVAVLHYMAGENLNAMRTEFVHAISETSVSCDVPLIVDKNNMQGMKSATTYAKRIGLESLSGIAPEDDDGNAAAKAAPAPRQQARPAPDHSQAVIYLQGADTLPDLAERWGKLPKETQRIPAVISAKDARKAELTPKEPDQSPITDDQIPY